MICGRRNVQVSAMRSCYCYTSSDGEN
jgi:hypothetical protein